MIWNNILDGEHRQEQQFYNYSLKNRFDETSYYYKNNTRPTFPKKQGLWPAEPGLLSRGMGIVLRSAFPQNVCRCNTASLCQQYSYQGIMENKLLAFFLHISKHEPQIAWVSFGLSLQELQKVSIWKIWICHAVVLSHDPWIQLISTTYFCVYE